MENNIQPQADVPLETKTPELSKLVPNRFPSKSFLFFLIFLFLGISVYFYLQTLSLRKEIVRINSLPTPNPTYVYTTAPSPTPTPVGSAINTARQIVNLLMPKYLDSPQDKETYKISFDKVGVNPKYYVTKDSFPKLVVEGDTYQFTLQIPKEGQSNIFTKIPVTSEVSTNQFNKATRLTNPLSYMETTNTGYEEGKSYYTYTTDYSTNCTQWSPTPPACSSLQLYYDDQLAIAKQVGIYASCISSDQSSLNCDKIISTLGIQIVNQ